MISDPTAQMAQLLAQPSVGPGSSQFPGTGPMWDDIDQYQMQKRAPADIFNLGPRYLPDNLRQPGPKMQGPALLPESIDAMFKMPPEVLQRMAGDVVPLPITPAPTAGKPPLAELVAGQKAIKMGDPQIIQHPARDEWANRIKMRVNSGQ